MIHYSKPNYSSAFCAPAAAASTFVLRLPRPPRLDQAQVSRDSSSMEVIRAHYSRTSNTRARQKWDSGNASSARSAPNYFDRKSLRNESTAKSVLRIVAQIAVRNRGVYSDTSRTRPPSTGLRTAINRGCDGKDTSNGLRRVRSVLRGERARCRYGSRAAAAEPSRFDISLRGRASVDHHYYLGRPLSSTSSFAGIPFATSEELTRHAIEEKGAKHSFSSGGIPADI